MTSDRHVQFLQPAEDDRHQGDDAGAGKKLAGGRGKKKKPSAGVGYGKYGKEYARDRPPSYTSLYGSDQSSPVSVVTKIDDQEVGGAGAAAAYNSAPALSAAAAAADDRRRLRAARSSSRDTAGDGWAWPERRSSCRPPSPYKRRYRSGGDLRDEEERRLLCQEEGRLTDQEDSVVCFGERGGKFWSGGLDEGRKFWPQRKVATLSDVICFTRRAGHLRLF